MKVKYFALIIAIMALLFYSCDDPAGYSGDDNPGGNSGNNPGGTGDNPGGTGDNPGGTGDNPGGTGGDIPSGFGGTGIARNGTTSTFWAVNFTTEKYYQLTADLKATGSKCKVWVEQGQTVVTTAMAQQMASEYDNNIYTKMMGAFGSTKSYYDGSVKVANDTMQYASFLGNNDGYLHILLLDIKDGFTTSNPYYTSGYFTFANFFEDNPASDRSNELAMIYLDTYPSISQTGLPGAYGTLVHEMQHLMNFTVSCYERFESGKGITVMDTWVNEGLSAASEQVYANKHSQSRVDWFNNDPVNGIIQGNNFFVWGNYTNQDPGYYQDDYATVYLFFQWLRLQANSTAIFQDIINSPYGDQRSVSAAANKRMAGNSYNDWGTLLKTWLAANYVNASTGPYGYRNDATLRTVQARKLLPSMYSTPPTSSSGFNLAPGEGIITPHKSLPGQSGYARYAGLPGRYSSSTSGTDALLSYNIDTRQDGPNAVCTPFSIETASQENQSRMYIDMSPRLTLSEFIGLYGPFALSPEEIISIKGYNPDNSFTGLEKLKLAGAGLDE